MPNAHNNSKAEGLSELKDTFSAGCETYEYYPVNQFAGADKLPISLKVLLENVVRNAESKQAAQDAADRVLSAANNSEQTSEVEFTPARVLFQDFTGVPVFVDFAVMREAAKNLGADSEKINPQVPCDLVIDHSVIANEFGCEAALQANMDLEYERNEERYKFLKWAQSSFQNVRIVPPGQGICHQLNIEKFASVVSVSQAQTKMQTQIKTSAQTQTQAQTKEQAQARCEQTLPLAYFDTLVGTDSHTPTANGIGVLGWGVGGIEAEAAALGQPISILVPRVIGVHLIGKLNSGISGMDVSLTFAHVLRKHGVVGCFVECFGEGVNNLSATQRACISNMTPEYGCTCTLFPVDDATLDYLRLTGRSSQQIDLVREYAKAQGFWNENNSDTKYSEVIEIDLSSIKRSLAGPARPHDRIDLSCARETFNRICDNRGLDRNKKVTVNLHGADYQLTHGALAIAAVTSCTTATDHAMMLAAGLVAKSAMNLGLLPKPWVKTVFAPGSHATTLLLKRAGLLEAMSEIGFSNCGYGCMSCIGNSGPVLPGLHDVAQEIELASVLSGNRNFEGRISADVSQNYLCAPALVVVYALAGTMDIDLERDALGTDKDGNNVYLRDIWPSDAEIKSLVEKYVDASLYEQGSAGMFEGDEKWQSLEGAASQGDQSTFSWDNASTYVRRAPYFDGMSAQACSPGQIKNARVLALLDDFITTDHISPAGAISPTSPAASYLRERGVDDKDFNTYGSRRGNHEVMMRGTFANTKLQNKLAPGRTGGWTRDFLANLGADGDSCERVDVDAGADVASGLSECADPSSASSKNASGKNIVSIFDAAMKYKSSDVPLVVLAGKMYGSGSSRDWAAKGPQLLGVRCVIAQSYERIHRSNLIGMGILPLQFEDGQSADVLGLDGSELFTIDPIDFSSGLPSPCVVRVVACKVSSDASFDIEKCNDSENYTSEKIEFMAKVRIDTPTEGKYFANGGILQYVLRSLV